MTHLLLSAGQAGEAGAAELEVLAAATDEAGDQVLAGATDEAEDGDELQSAQVLESVLTGSTYLVLVTVEAWVIVVVSSTEDQSPHVDSVPDVVESTGAVEDQSIHVSVELVAGSTAVLEVQSPQVSVADVVGSTAVLEVQSPQVSVADVVGSTAVLEVQSPHVSVADVVGSTAVLEVQSPHVSEAVVVGSTGLLVLQSSHVSVLLVLAGSTGVEELSQSLQVFADVVLDFVLEVFFGSVAEEEEVQPSQRNEVVVEVVEALTGAVDVLVVLLVVPPSTGVFEVAEAEVVVVFQSTHVSRATFS